MASISYRTLCPLVLALGVLPSCRRPEIAVLYSERDGSESRVGCPPGLCERLAVDEFDCGRYDAAFDVVILDGHSEPPVYLDRSASELASALACMAPSLIVLDTCHGFSSPLLRAIAERVPGALVVGSTDKIWMDGLNYGDGFFRATSPEERAQFVTSHLGESVYAWRPSVDELDLMESALSTWSSEQLSRRLVHTLPNLVRAPSPDGVREVIFVVPSERFK